MSSFFNGGVWTWQKWANELNANKCNNTKIYIICGYPLVRVCIDNFCWPWCMLYTINVAFCKYAWVLIIQFRPNILHINGKKSIFNISSQQLSNLFTSSHKNEGKSSSKNNFQYFVNSCGRMFYVGLSNEDRAKHCFI